jgi:predicted nucleic acid-binding Zn ribbon protein
VLDAVVEELAPRTTLAGVQGAWSRVAGAAVAAAAQPVSERDGVVTFVCSSAVWASELDLLRTDLVDRLNEALAGGAPVRDLRFRAASAGDARRPYRGRARRVP